MKWEEMSEREKNILVGEQIFDWVPDPEEDIWFEGDKSRHPDFHPFVSQISLAWEVLEKSMAGLFSERQRFWEEFQKQVRLPGGGLIAFPDVFGHFIINKKFPEAISKAALKSKGVKI